MKHIFRLLIAFLSVAAGSITTVRADDGLWTPHLAFQDATCCMVADSKVYALYGQNLLEHDFATGVTTHHSQITGLSEAGIKQIAYDVPTGKLVIIYDSGNIDILDSRTGRFSNMPGLKNIFEGIVTVNRLRVGNGEAFVSTGNGVVCIGIEGREIRAYYNIGRNVRDAVVADSVVYAACDNEIIFCPLVDNPLDPSSWKTLKTCKTLWLTGFANALNFQLEWNSDVNEMGLWRAIYNRSTGTHTMKQILPSTLTFHSNQDSVLVVGNDARCLTYTANKPENPAKWWSQKNEWKSIALMPDGTFITAEGGKGLCVYAWNAEGTAIEATGDTIGTIGPKRDLCYYSRFTDGRLLVAGGRLDNTDRTHYPPTALMYENGEWKAFDETGVDIKFFDTRGDYTSIVQDPARPNHHFVSSAGYGVLEFLDFKMIKNYNTHNSALQTAASDGNQRYVRVDGLNYDRDGNLWMLNCAQDSVIKVLKKDSTWMSIHAKGLVQAPAPEKSMFDSKGRFWVCSRRTMDMHQSGIYCMDYGGDLTKVDTDKQTFRSSATNQDGRSCSFESAYCIVEDKRGEIWFGTASGLYVISNPDTWGDSNFLITQIKVPRNDGTNLADYLLAGVGVTAIAVDGANRKWIGTAGSGLYLVSPDGTEVLEQFTTENSALLDDGILSLSFDEATGNVFIGTEKGMIAYASGVTLPAETLSESNVKVYPNPVRPEHNRVTIEGLTDGAEVKVTTLTGNVVAAGYSTGGTFTWDCCGLNGDRVATGVYLILAVTADGKDGIVSKVVVI